MRAAHDSLSKWETSLRALAVTPAPGSPHNGTELLAILNDAKHGLSHLLAQMGAHADAAVAAPAGAIAGAGRELLPNLAEASAVYAKACRACGHALGAAFREAQAAADAASAKMLYGSLRAFEKQIWVLDPRQTD